LQIKRLKMIAVLQYVKQASVSITKNNKAFTFSQIKNGIVMYLGICSSDTKHDLEYILNKFLQLKMIPKKDGRFGIPVKDANPELLVISEFTLCADIKHGSHVSFNTAMSSNQAYKMFSDLVLRLNKHLDIVRTGKFGADMQVNLTNNGPITFILNSKGYRL